ncbi:MAG: glycosyltransferase [Chitinophagaceae bacterium]
MHIVIAHDAVLPALKYGGTERVVWWLTKALKQLGHRVTLLAKAGTICPFADVIIMNQEPEKQVPESADLVHYFGGIDFRKLSVPYIYTMEGNAYDFSDMDLNRVFVSKAHAALYGSEVYVYNGLDPEDYGDPGLKNTRSHCHFLGMGSWKVKNLKGVIRVSQKAKLPLQVMGGHRVSFSSPIRITLDPTIKFLGMIGGAEKNQVMRGSKALLFPVLWSEPFGIAITESLYFGCPVLGTPYGSLPELVGNDVGFLSASANELATVLKDVGQFSGTRCHEFVMDAHTHLHMARSYLVLYEKVMNGQMLHRTPPRYTAKAAGRSYPFRY